MIGLFMPNPPSTRSRSPLGTAIAALIAVVLLVSLAFPVLARAYASNSIPELSNDAPSGTGSGAGTGTASDDWVPPADTPEGLGIRNLPLLSDEAVAAWQGSPEGAMNTFAERLFSGNWPEVMEAALAYARSDKGASNATPGHGYGRLGELVNAVVVQADIEEELVLDAIGLSVLYASDLNVERRYGTETSVALALLAFALSEATASTFGTCESIMTEAHVFSMSLFYADHYEELQQLWAAAVNKCGDDPSALVWQYRARLWAYLAGEEDRTWEQATADVALLLERFPEVPAAHVVAGDILSAVATASASYYGPFTSRRWQLLAQTQYRTAMDLGYAPEVVLAADPGVTALESMRDPAAGYSEVLHALASATAELFDYAKAVRVEEAALIAETAPDVPVLVQSKMVAERALLDKSIGRWSDRGALGTVPLGAQSTALNLWLLGGMGGGSGVEYRGFLPQSRVDGDRGAIDYGSGRIVFTGFTVLPRLALLSHDWSLGAQRCEAADQGYLVCETVTARSEGPTITPLSYDYTQNLYRVFGDLQGARIAALEWADHYPQDPLARERLGEIAILGGDYEGSVSHLVTALDLYDKSPLLPYYPQGKLLEWSGHGTVILKLATAYRALGKYAEASATLDMILSNSSQPLQFFAELERAQIAYGLNDFAAVITHAGKSASYCTTHQGQLDGTCAVGLEAVGVYGDGGLGSFSTEAQAQLTGLAHFGLGDYDQALYWAEQALSGDPFNPLYLEAVADATRAGGSSCGVLAAPVTVKVNAGVGANVRPTPDTSAEAVDYLEKSTSVDVSGFTHGENVQGNDVWFKVPAGWAWSGAFQTLRPDVPELDRSGKPICDTSVAPSEPTNTNAPDSNDEPDSTPPPDGTDEPDGTESAPDGEDASRAQMIAAYRAALAIEPSLFSSWNNLGVLLAQSGDTAGALSAFENAVSARPDYPLGWFNLGVIENETSGFLHFVRAQGALGKAGSLNFDLKNQEPALTFDDEVYSSTIDVSKEIPADWHHGASARSNSNALTLGLVLLLAVRAGGELARDLLAGFFGERTLGRKKPKWLSTLLETHPWWPAGAAVSWLSLLYLSGAHSVSELLLCGGAALALLGLHALVPRFVGAGELRNVTWLPASLLTVLLSLVGLGFAPPAPLVDADGVEEAAVARNHRVAILGLAVVTLVLGGVAVATAVPVARANAIMALILLSSALIPVHPLDGAHLGFNRKVDLGVTAALALGTVCIALNWL
jgi:tetratricopeptide (TPR) repeat protein